MKACKIPAMRTKRFLAILICLMTVIAVLPPRAASAEEKSRVVRVGWYDSPFNTFDEHGRRSGYAYEYQQKIAAYTGWEYEYVEGSWPQLLQMLSEGKIDLMSDVSYTKDRSEDMLFPNLPMGTEEYYVFVSADNSEISKDDPQTLSGKKVGVDKDSIQTGLFKEWAQKNGIEAELVELTNSEDETFQMMQNGTLDAFVTLDAYGANDSVVPRIEIGSSDFYFAVSKSRPDLLKELNSAMGKIRDEDRFYNQHLSNKHIQTSGTYIFLDESEKKWLTEHGPVKVGYQDNYLAFCDADEKTGKLNGALKEYLDQASGCFGNAEIEFEPVAYPSVSKALEALRYGEVDCVFPSNLSTSESENLGLVMTPSIMRAEKYAVVHKSDKDSFAQKSDVTAAVVEDEPNYESIMVDRFPDWDKKYYSDVKACLSAVSEGKADCMIMSNYQYNSYGRQCEKYKLTTLATGQSVDFCIAVGRDNNELYSILAKTTSIVSNSAINAALTYYSAETAKTRFIDLLLDNMGIVIAVAVGIVALIIILIIQRRMIIAERKAAESQRIAENLSEHAYVDALTSVRNKRAYDEYISSLQERIEGGEALECAICVFDCDNLKYVNDKFGHEKGDKYIKAATMLICHTFKHSAVFRVGGDEFSAVLLNDDFNNRDELVSSFDKAQSETLKSNPEPWEQVRVAVGIAEYDPKTDNSLIDTIRRADDMMYDNKRERKKNNS